MLDFNMTTKAVNLIGLSLKDGTTVVDREFMCARVHCAVYENADLACC